MFPTLNAILGHSNAPLKQPQDGMDILPAVEGTMTFRKAPIGFAWAKQAAWMTQQYKLLCGLGDSHAKPQLFDILNDPYETKNIAAKHPDKVRQMKAALSEWIMSCNLSSGSLEAIGLS